MYSSFVNPLPDDCLKLKAVADDKLNFTHSTEFAFRCGENIEGKEENAGYQHFFLFPQCFIKVLPNSVFWLVCRTFNYKSATSTITL